MNAPSRGCSSTGSSWRPRRRRTRSSTRPTAARSGRRPMRPPPTSTPRSRPPGVPSTRATGRTTGELRVRCLRQLHQALVDDGRRLRALTVAEVGMPDFMMGAAGFDVPVDGLAWVDRPGRAYEFETDLGVAKPMGIPTRRTVRREPVGVVAAITPWNVPNQINLAKIGPALAAGCTVVLKPAPDTPWVGCRARPAGRRAHRHPGRGLQRGHAARQRGRCRADHGPARRHGLVHRLDRDRAGDHGRRRADAEEGLPRAGRQVRRDRARRRRRRRGRRRHGVRRVHPRRPGLRAHHPADRAAGEVRRGGAGRRRDDGVDRRPTRPTRARSAAR